VRWIPNDSTMGWLMITTMTEWQCKVKKMMLREESGSESGFVSTKDEELACTLGYPTVLFLAGRVGNSNALQQTSVIMRVSAFAATCSLLQVPLN
jgi:hypothetical protein